MAIKIKDLEHIYSPGTPFEKTAIHDINLDIKKGEFVGLIGHTGSGKSTLIQHLNGLMKPTSGSVYINDQNIHDKEVSLKKIRQQVGLVFQYPEYQLFEMTVYKDVSFGPINMELEEDKVTRRVNESLELVGIEKEVFEESPFELSGGQKRRVAIAGVLAMNPDILILDEPTAGLDPLGRHEILGQIKKMHEKLGMTILLVSHSMEDIAKHVDRLIVMDQGTIAIDGEPREVFSKVKKLESIGLGAPQIKYIMEALSKKWKDLPQDILTVEEAADIIASYINQGSDG